jgi:uncharacterized membrane protein HdeD (DUF308 family)
MKFVRVYILFLNLSARLFGALALVAGIFFLVSAYAFGANRSTYVVAGIFAMAVGVAVFMAKPITPEDIARIGQRKGGSE